jgi:hypothetical protein
MLKWITANILFSNERERERKVGVAGTLLFHILYMHMDVTSS